MKIAKVFLLVGLAAFTGSSLVGCGGGAEDKSPKITGDDKNANLKPAQRGPGGGAAGGGGAGAPKGGGAATTPPVTKD